VSLAIAGMGTKRIRIANLPPEVPSDKVRALLAPLEKCLIYKQKCGPRLIDTQLLTAYDR
jgi:hypothetical protein